MTSVALGSFLVLLVAALIAAFYFLDRLIRHQYRVHRDAWEQAGRPVGYLFRPPEATWFRSGFAFQRCALAWVFYTPLWAREDPTARHLLSRLRWCVLIWNVGIIVFFFLFLTHVVATQNV